MVHSAFGEGAGAGRESSMRTFGGLLAEGAAGFATVRDSGVVILIFCIVVVVVMTLAMVFRGRG